MTIRIGELKAFKWCNVDWKARKIYIGDQALNTRQLNDDMTFGSCEVSVVPRIKGNTERGKREIPLTTEAIRILEKARELNPTGKYLFMPYEELMLTDTFNEYLKKYCKQADVPYYSSHKIRFTSASSLYNGANLIQVSKQMGHSQVSTTLHYFRNVHDDQDILNEMEDAFKVTP